MDQKEILLQRVSNDYKVSTDIIKGPNRKSELVDIRCLIATVLFVAGHSKSAIGRFLGNRHHTTIMSLIKRGKKRLDIQLMAEGYLKLLR